MRLGDIGPGQVGAYPRPRGLELGYAVLKIGAAAVVAAKRRLAVEREAPTPLLRWGWWHAIAFHDPANRQRAPDHLIIVRLTLAAAHGDAQYDGFVVGHASHPDRCRSHGNMPI